MKIRIRKIISLNNFGTWNISTANYIKKKKKKFAKRLFNPNPFSGFFSFAKI